MLTNPRKILSHIDKAYSILHTPSYSDELLESLTLESTGLSLAKLAEVHTEIIEDIRFQDNYCPEFKHLLFSFDLHRTRKGRTWWLNIYFDILEYRDLQIKLGKEFNEPRSL
jgi:hypothetical protein